MIGRKATISYGNSTPTTVPFGIYKGSFLFLKGNPRPTPIQSAEG
ncbi:hypothetical protein LEP1GSC161_1535 [Leptospira santarosai str. CBC1416]|uniref:Uncharacterized protein n=2 Tax=Leptospira santarosai TaxID=28183 RepID=A0A0E2BGU3_9LEPT|nr:hypothetical protein LEP1GSC179_3365 [Leptospira santarosai str. MOR084]EMJ47159.1 hypothetical protein LEP1GSC169_3775 [Leptospira santarosai str. HAI1349]EMO13728.1 hypothetical protein LEP1GSC165_3336 [Leptospira santarosai str. CBC523]EMO33608.1 hypothetical protein LEP1GSC175_2812 [Leptospira santarosai str. HAI821]EMO58199.1 hypothetical protein LEP1GSC161_1535 [Leptospira santarosai str. CBC1416]